MPGNVSRHINDMPDTSLASMLTLSACYNTTLEIDSKTGYYTDPDTKKPVWDTGIVVTSIPVNPDDFKSLIVIDDSSHISTANGFDNFIPGRTKNLIVSTKSR